MRSLRARAGPLGPVVLLFSTSLVGLFVSRLVLLWRHWDRVRDVPGVWEILPIGLRLDVMTLSWLLLPLAVVILVWPGVAQRARNAVVAGYLALVAGLLTFLEAATYPFLAQYDSRPNRIFLDYLAYPREVVATVWADHRLAVVLDPELSRDALAHVQVPAMLYRERRYHLPDVPAS